MSKLSGTKEEYEKSIYTTLYKMIQAGENDMLGGHWTNNFALGLGLIAESITGYEGLYDQLCRYQGVGGWMATLLKHNPGLELEIVLPEAKSLDSRTQYEVENGLWVYHFNRFYYNRETKNWQYEKQVKRVVEES